MLRNPTKVFWCIFDALLRWWLRIIGHLHLQLRRRWSKLATRGCAVIRASPLARRAFSKEWIVQDRPFFPKQLCNDAACQKDFMMLSSFRFVFLMHSPRWGSCSRVLPSVWQHKFSIQMFLHGPTDYSKKSIVFGTAMLFAAQIVTFSSLTTCGFLRCRMKKISGLFMNPSQRACVYCSSFVVQKNSKSSWTVCSMGHLVYDADTPAWVLQQLQHDAKEFVGYLGCKVKFSSSLEWLGDIPLVYECI